ncbi:hypothetical protein APHAL10511_005921 [Amanita phalloides]|nr:hypothetical protein APHAL10511_005921 [Amanita phalloides]
MAAAPQLHPFQQGKGSLMPGQTIVVNKHSIQVERYLSQGGFAHVYLVRTATPVYNTTHHVLKRIAVPDQPMLTEVKKEVDIMRLLKGHPNIVHFIDAAWHKMSNGMFEVFILMEYCPGGGIIDMMNRRLRERLTEAEILQIFVDVCEAVAYMHNLRPPLLHRDLKVENILQSSQASYKLCDFGSATAVSRPPANIQELRMLEADLNKHTTIQYRAPEMIDVHMRRPIDEKSDVWALGVLLYKLCYYTTPFEEHGPLAILQVLYKIPPYPVYSPQINALIGKMLKDHGTMRPTVFETLSEVHRMRGTKSQFQYNISVPQPLSPNRPPHAKRPTLSPLDGVITYKPSKSPHKQQSSVSSSPSRNQGQLARDKVMEAIAPMRRGRPSPSKDFSRSSSRQASPHKEQNDEKAWKSWAAGTKQSSKSSSLFDDDPWKVAKEKENVHVNAPTGFNDNFGERFRPSMDHPAAQIGLKQISASKSASLPKEASVATRHTPHSAISIVSRKIPPPRMERDAFEGLGLGLPSDKPEPILGEARKLRTGLAILGSTRPRLESDNRTSSPRPSYLTPQPYLQTQGFLSTSPSNASSASSTAQIASRPPSSMNIDGMPIESRFPSLEELDVNFLTSGKSQKATQPPILPSSAHLSTLTNQSTTPQAQKLSEATSNTAPTSRSETVIQGKQGSSHTRVIQLVDNTGDRLRLDKGKALPSSMIDGMPPRRVASLSLKPTVTHRRHVSISPKDRPSVDDSDKSMLSRPTRPPPFNKDEGQLRTPPKLTAQVRDWLTSDEDIDSPTFSSHTASAELPILRRSPSKRASLVEKSDIYIHEAVIAQPEGNSTANNSATDITPTVVKFSQHFPPVINGKDVFSDAWDTSAGLEGDSSSSGADDGPEDVNGSAATVKSGKQSRGRSRRSSVHDLVDLWGGAVHSKNTEQKTEQEEKVTSNSRDGVSSYLEPEMINQKLKQKLSSEGTFSSSSRTRPQSLLLPLRPTDSSYQKSQLLEAPPEIKQRQSIRRSSITDMVERYEAMGSNPNSAGPSSPSRVKKSASSKSMHEHSHSVGSLNIGASLAVPPSPSTPSTKQRASPTKLMKTGLSPSPSADRRVFPDSSKPPDMPEGHKADMLPRTRKLSLKPHENTKPPISLHELLAADERNEKLTEQSSPDRSYQGVGRLIDQWQRKAEAAEPRTPGAKRSSVITKRPTTAGNG